MSVFKNNGNGNSKKIVVVFICPSFSARQNIFVTFVNSNGILSQKKISNYTRYGRISGKTLRGFLRHAIEKLLLTHGVAVCHPLPLNTLTAPRNKEYFKQDKRLGYHGRGECEKNGGCPVYQMFGDLGHPSNLIVSSIYFHPSSSGGTSAKNGQKIFGQIGEGRVEIDHDSPRMRADTSNVYMTSETLVGTYIEAPWTIIIRDGSELHEILIYKALELIFQKNLDWDYDFMIGGNRSAGCGRVVAVQVNEEGKFLTQGRNCMGIPLEEAREIDAKFEKFITELRLKFPIIEENNGSEGKKRTNETKQNKLKKKKDVEEKIRKLDGF